MKLRGINDILETMKRSGKYIWDYDVDQLDLEDPEVLKWYLKRKVEYGDWEAIDRDTLSKYLPELEINPYLKQILKGFLEHE